ncbi:hypothetical protein WJX72_006141 [[Myrmecia] bisecta]|uniref:Fungal lipase-type domain-containing protein n=1 Tax=[Myrmecia] bisecta TaxID=41462 RepID=A0AAW1QR03_9CHLO
MFCFETALKLQYWASLVYGYREGLPATTPTTRPGTLEVGMRLFPLEQSEMLWEKQGDTHVLIAWAGNRIVIAFRGRASLANVYTDLQAWRTSHPASVGHAWLGTHAMVLTDLCHRAFHGWLHGELCAFDIQQQLADTFKLAVCCMPFGAPRTGNHAFARAYDKVVPNTWHIINEQDAVAHKGKCMMYKRAGPRVLINPRGDLIVRPSLVEHSLRRMPGGSSVKQHLLTSYRKSMLAVINAQSTQKRAKSGYEAGKGARHAAGASRQNLKGRARPATVV